MKDADIFEKVKNIEREIRELCDKRYRDGVSDGFDDGYNQGYFDAKGTKDDEIRKQGRKDAWECARKIVASDAGTLYDAFGKHFTLEVFGDNSASEAMAKIKEYEEKQKQTEKKCCDCKHYVTDGHITFCSHSKVGGCCVNKDNWTPKKMTLDEAIKHCEEVADSKCDECGAEHRQLAEWLKELKQLREQTRWIPVTERLPKTADVYRVTRYYLNNVMNPKYIVDACFFDGSNTWYNDNRINHERNYADNIIAWQENPEPYKTESEE